MDTKLSPDERAALLERAMTLPEKIGLLHGKVGSSFRGEPAPAGALGSAGYIPGIPRLGIPALQESDAGLGVTNPRGGGPATGLPRCLRRSALAATWDPELAYRGGGVIGSEARRKGFNVMLAGGMNLTREPRNGRNFEYCRRGPAARRNARGRGDARRPEPKRISTVKHFALNDQETGRMCVDARNRRRPRSASPTCSRSRSRSSAASPAP